jgi:hypothetical protein
MDVRLSALVEVLRSGVESGAIARAGRSGRGNDGRLGIGWQ